MNDQILAIIENYQFLSPILILLIGIVLKVLLDLNLGIVFVKYFYWLSLRGVFRQKATKISGIYKQSWNIKNSDKYKSKSDRQSLITLKQLNNYCFGEFFSKGDKYYLFGEIIERKIIGHWADSKSKLGYFGSFELTIIDRERIEGFWIGHSNEQPQNINTHDWKFRAITDTSKFLIPIQIKILFRNLKKSLKRRFFITK